MIESWGLVIVILMVLPEIVITPCVILSHPGIAVGVVVGATVGVKLDINVGMFVGELVGWSVPVGVFVGVLVGSGVNVIICPDEAVAVGVFDGTVAVGVSDGTADVDIGVFVAVEPDPESSSINPSTVRALDEVMVREGIGIRPTMGL